MEEKVATLKRELLALQTREALLGVDDYQAVVRLRLVESFASKASRWLLNVDKYAEFHQPSLLVKTKKTSELQDFAAVLHDLHLISSPDGANLSELDVLFKAIRDGHREEWPLVDDSVLLEESFFDGLEDAPKKAMHALVEACRFLNTKVGDKSVFGIPRMCPHEFKSMC